MAEPHLLHGITDAAIRRRVGSETFVRGERYARAGRVVSISPQAGGKLTTARVRGTGSRFYTTTIVWQDSEPGSSETGWLGMCSCPMTRLCKHCVAVLLEVRRRAESQSGTRGSHATAPMAPTWQSLLAPVARSVAPGAVARPSGSPREPMALSFRVQQRHASPWAQQQGVAVAIRPMMRGRSGKWIKTGANWVDLLLGTPDQVDPDQLDALSMLWRRACGRNSQWLYAQDYVSLSLLSPRVWDELRVAREVGVEFVTDPWPNGEVVLGPTLTPTLDATVATTGGHLHLTPGLTDTATVATDHGAADQAAVDQGAAGQGPTAPGASAADAADSTPGADVARVGLHLIGSPHPHGWYRLEEPDRTSPGRLILGGFATPLSAPITALLRAEPVVVPAADIEDFFDSWYPQLRTQVTVTSHDGSVELPVPQPPRLALSVRVAGEHTLDLEWSFRYGRPDRPRTIALYADGDGPGWREPDTERSLRERVSELARAAGLDCLFVRGQALASAQVLTGMQTARFVTALLPALREADWAEVELVGEPLAYTRVDEAPVVSLSVTEAGRDAGDLDAPFDHDWFDLGVAVTVGGEEVPFERLFTALATGEPQLLLDSGMWFDLDRPEYDTLRRLIAEARALRDRPSDGLRITPYQAGLWEELVGLGVVAAQSARWERTVAALLGTDGPPVADPPAGLTATLRPYQRDGFGWLSQLWSLGLGGILADDMGLGKTLQVLALIQHAKETGALTAPVLIVAPTSVLASWAGEAARFAPGLKVTVVSETAARRRRVNGQDIDVVGDSDIVVTSYAIFRLDMDRWQERAWSALVLDEAQAVKNHQARAYQCARRLEARIKLALTGTPLENSLMDLWSLLSIVAPGAFPNPAKFSEMYRRPIESGAAPETLASLRRRIRPLILRRTKDSVALDLPPKQEQTLRIELPAAHRRSYDTYLHRERQRLLKLIDEDFNAHRITILKSLTTMRLMALHPSLADDSYPHNPPPIKVEVLVDQLTEIAAEGHRALVFSQFTRFLGMVKHGLDAAGIGYSYLDGRTRDRARRIEAFRTGDDPVFLISLKAGGVGLTLTEADYVFVLDPWWNPAVENQAIDRAHRIGQTKTVMVYRMVAADTIEDKVAQLQHRKRHLFDQVVDQGELASGVLGADDIRGLLGIA